VSFHALQHPKFRKILHEARGVGDRYAVPNRSRMGGDLLDTHFARTKESVADKLVSQRVSQRRRKGGRYSG
jgi:hypothetical protein